jgi:acetyl-CoA carboxylase carboxyltransferase component
MGDSKDHPAKNPVDSPSPATSPELNDLPPSLSTSPNPPETLNETQPALQGVSIQSSATSRLHQLSSHLSSPNTPESLIQDAPPNQTQNTKRTRRRSKSTSRSSSSDLPADYSDILTNLAIMKKMNNTPDPTNRGYVRQKLAGKLWARERIEKLLDKDSWREVGSASGTATWTVDAKNPQSEHVEGFTPSNNPQGFGNVTCLRTGQRRQIYLTADDFSIRSGHADGSNSLRTLHGEKLALKLKLPVVKLVDGSSGGGSVTTIRTQGYAYLPHVILLSTVVKQLNAGIPNLGAIVGPAIGLGAARVVSTHFSVMAGDIGSLFNAGPKVVEGATFEEGLSFSDLGGPAMHCTNGTIDNLAPNEEGCFDQIRTVLGYLPDCGQLQAPPCSPCEDDVNREDLALRSIIPRRKARMYNPLTIIESVVDRGSWFEIGPLWGRTGITGLARLGGRPVGILSMNCEVNGGALDAAGSQKLMKMIKLWQVPALSKSETFWLILLAAT